MHANETDAGSNLASNQALKLLNPDTENETMQLPVIISI